MTLVSNGRVSNGKALIPALLVAAATSLPLLLPAGRNFEYEYWLIATAIFGLGLVIATTWRPWPGGGGWRSVATGLALPLLAVVMSGLWRHVLSCPCATGEWAVWWLWQFAPSALAFYALCLLLADLVQRYQLSRWQAATIALFIALGPLLLLWFYPQKRMLGLFVGYIHGPIYDRLIPFTHEQQLIRLTQGLIALGLIWLGGRRWFTAAFGLAVAVSLSLSSLSTSTGHGHSSLQSALSETIHRPGLTLHYAPGSISAQRATELADEAAFHAQNLSAKLGLEDSRPKVAIYVYPDQLRKKAWFGGLTTDVTDVYSPSIHITADRFPHGTLRHELVHALTSEVGFKGLGFHPNMAITEGLAVYFAPRLSRYSLHTEAATITKLFWQSQVAGLFGPLFWTYSGARAYQVAGSLLGYLTDRFGSDAVMALYAGASFNEAFGYSREQVVSDWQAMLEATHDPILDDTFRRRYAYGGVLSDTCPHSRASARQAARSARVAKDAVAAVVSEGAMAGNDAGVRKDGEASMANATQKAEQAPQKAEQSARKAAASHARAAERTSWWWQQRAGGWQLPTVAKAAGQTTAEMSPRDLLGQIPDLTSTTALARRQLAIQKALQNKDLAAGLMLRLLLRQVSLNALLGLPAGHLLTEAKALPGQKPPGLARLIALFDIMATRADPALDMASHRFLLSGKKSHLANRQTRDIVATYLAMRNAPDLVRDCHEASLPPDQPYVLARAWYQQQLSCVYRLQAQGHKSAALGTIKAWQAIAPEGSEDARALAIEAALARAVLPPRG